jgi:hypothetical protein
MTVIPLIKYHPLSSGTPPFAKTSSGMGVSKLMSGAGTCVVVVENDVLPTFPPAVSDGVEITPVIVVDVVDVVVVGRMQL